MFKLLLALLATQYFLLPRVASAEESVCFGTTSSGRLQNGVKLPTSGKNFEAYSTIAAMLGRTYVHSEVKEILLASYKELLRNYPDKVFKYAETGFQEGGQFKPHKTHHNGLSVDHMVPVKRGGQSVHLPTNAFNKWGYNIEFDIYGKYDKFRIDYESLAALIVELHKQSVNRGHDLWRVIFDPKMQKDLFKTAHGKYLKENVSFSKKRSWVRHDEHIHVDFQIPCKESQ